MNLSPTKPDYRGNVLCQIFFLWLDTLFFRGYRTQLTQQHLRPCPREQLSEDLYDKFHKHWREELHKTTPDIKIALAKTLKLPFLIGGIFHFTEALLLLVQAVLVSEFSNLCITYHENSTANFSSGSSESHGASLSLAVTISAISLYLSVNHSIAFDILYCVGMQMRTVCITAIYRKVLRIRHSELSSTSTGHIINLASNDVYKFEMGILFWNFYWISPLIVILSMVILILYIGPIGLVGIFYILLHAPLQISIGFLFGHFRYLQSLTTDKRILLMDGIIRGIRVVKFYVWENYFIKSISRVRNREVYYASLSGVCQSTTFSFFNTSIFIAMFLLYTASVAAGDPLSPSHIGLAFLVLNTLRIDTVLVIGYAIFSWRESVTALKRIQHFLELPEHIQVCLNTEDNPHLIDVRNFSASWKGSGNLVLKYINLTCDQPQLVVITGPVSAGKTSLLLCLIRELPGIAGKLTVASTPSYASQEPWIFSGTLRENILFGNPLNTTRYRHVINVCCLREDIEMFVEGDLTVIGERGVTLSGGQKTRVSLARSVYKDVDIYLFDDPMSSVDAEVGRELFYKCLRGFLSDKLVLLVTHHTHYVKQADYVIVMRDGEIEGKGIFREFVKENEFCRKYLQGLDNEGKGPQIHTFSVECITHPVNPVYSIKRDRLGITPPPVTDGTLSHQPLSTPLSTERFRRESHGTATYLKYFLAGGVVPSLSLLALTVLSNSGLLLAYWWVQTIATCSQSVIQYSNTSSNVANLTIDVCSWYFDVNNPSSFLLLGLLTISGSGFMFLRGFNFYYLVLQAGRRLHKKMLVSVINTKLYFFDTNPSGRILNRFSKDTGFMDEQLPMIFYDFWQSSTYNIAIAIACCFIQKLLIIPIIFLCLTTLSLRYYYLKTSTQVKHLESISRSPLYSHISLTLQGLATIRALRMEDKLTRDFYHFQDEHTRAWHNYTSCQKWFGLRLDILTSFLAVFGIFSAFLARCIFKWDELTDFSIPLLLTLPSTFQYVVRLSAEVDILMVSVDRVLDYCDLYQENTLACTSPARAMLPVPTGRIEFKNVFFRYSDHLPYSLQDVCLVVFPGEKIGIIGRTGAGKSSLLSSLLLVNSPSAGSITVNDVDITTFETSVHRRRLTVIPQDPFLFSGTLRENLDPLGEFTDNEIWEALDKSYLKSKIEALPDQFVSPVGEHGLNFSTGARQLICLTRAMLRRNQIILIDEATANVDLQTDWLVQGAIRSHFSDCTVLTIAHRIETIISSDRIVVMGNGRIVETGTPLLMLQREDSYLSRLIGQMDEITQINLRSSALRNHQHLTK